MWTIGEAEQLRFQGIPSLLRREYTWDDEWEQRRSQSKLCHSDMAQGERRSEFLPYSPKGDSRKTYEFEIKVWTTEETLVRTYQKRGANRGSKISKHLNTRTNV